MEDKIDKCKEILKDCLGDDFVHGVPHIERMLRDFEILLKDNNRFEEDLINALEIAIYLHDVGRKNAKELDVNHADHSVVILRDYFSDFYQSLERKDDIAYAIKNHNKDIFKEIGKERSIMDDKNKLRALLSLLDCADTVGWTGINRAAMDKNTPLVPVKDKDFNNKLKRVLELSRNPKGRTKDDSKRMKDSSILEHVLDNYCLTIQLRDRLSDYISEDFKKKINQRINISEEFCKTLSDRIVRDNNV